MTAPGMHFSHVVFLYAFLFHDKRGGLVTMQGKLAIRNSLPVGRSFLALTIEYVGGCKGWNVCVLRWRELFYLRYNSSGNNKREFKKLKLGDDRLATHLNYARVLHLRYVCPGNKILLYLLLATRASPYESAPSCPSCLRLRAAICVFE